MGTHAATAIKKGPDALCERGPGLSLKRDGLWQLPALVPLAEDLHRGVDVALAELLDFIEILDHLECPGCEVRDVERWTFIGICCAMQGKYMHRTIKSRVFGCSAICDTLWSIAWL